MNETRKKFTTVDDYIADFPAEIRVILETVRKTIRETAPEASERMSYGMPGYYLNGPLVYFAAFKNHIGFYPVTSGMTRFQDELTGYVRGKGSVQFPLGRPIPFDLIRRITEFRAAENLEKAETRKR